MIATLRASAVALTGLGIVAACSSGPAPADPVDVTNDAGPTSVPTETPPQGKPPTSGKDSGPELPELDAGDEPDGSGDAGPPCATTPPGNACGLVPQCGCAASETCDIMEYVAGEVGCVPFGKAAAGLPCTTTSGCAKGLTCVFGTCHAFCDVDGAPCASGSCLALTSTDDKPIPNFEVCTTRCDLRDPAACGGVTPAGTGVCSLDGAGSTDCNAGGNLKERDPCSVSEPCGPALVCITLKIGNDTSSECRRWCRVGTNDCGAGKSCQGFSTKEIVDGIEFGICS